MLIRNRVGMTVIDVDYRLTPGTFPEYSTTRHILTFYREYISPRPRRCLGGYSLGNIFPNACQSITSSNGEQVHNNAGQLNIRPDSISIGGISAGGHISAVCQQLARDANLPLKLGMSSTLQLL